jgi:hypothetical protein
MHAMLELKFSQTGTNASLLLLYALSITSTLQAYLHSECSPTSNFVLSLLLLHCFAQELCSQHVLRHIWQTA